MVRPFATLDEWGEIWGTPWKPREKNQYDQRVQAIQVLPSHRRGHKFDPCIPTIQSEQTDAVSG